MTKSQRLGIFLTLLLSQTTYSAFVDDLETYTDQECLAALNHETFAIGELTPEVLAMTMNRGLWTCAKEIARISNEARMDFRSIFDLESRIITKELGLLKLAIESGRPMSTINPAFQWAQSPTDVFLNVKFAHKLDAPATLNVEAQNVSLGQQSLVLRASDGRKLFILELDFLKEIVPEESTWSMASVGRMTINLKKKVSPSKWVRLTRNRKKPNNLHYWFEIHEKYSADLEKIKEDEEDGEEDQENESESKTANNTSTNTTTVNATNTNSKKKSKKEKRGDKIGESEEEKEKAQERQRLKSQLTELEERVKEKKKEVEEESRQKKKLIDEEAEKEKETLRQQHTEKLRLLEEKYSQPSSAKVDL